MVITIKGAGIVRVVKVQKMLGSRGVCEEVEIV